MDRALRYHGCEEKGPREDSPGRGDRSRQLYELLLPAQVRPSALELKQPPSLRNGLVVNARILPFPRLGPLPSQTIEVAQLNESRRINDGSPCCPEIEIAGKRRQDYLTSNEEEHGTRGSLELFVELKNEELKLWRPQPDREMTVLEARQLREESRRRRELGSARSIGGSSSHDGSKQDQLEMEYDEDDEQCCVGPEFVIRNDMTPEQVLAVKKARRKEQCRVNQANYRKRKRAFELQIDRQIVALQDEIEHLRAWRNMARRQIQSSSASESHPRDPLDVVHHVYSQFSQTTTGKKQLRAPSRHADTIFALEREEFTSADDLLGQWRFHRSVFQVFELQLCSVHSVDIGDSLVITAEASLKCPVFAIRHRHPAKPDDDNPVVTWPVAQRFLFDRSCRELAKIISEVDWLAGLWKSSPRPLQYASELVTKCKSHNSDHATPC